MPLLLNPGPTNVSPLVKQELLSEDTNHREPKFVSKLHELREKLTILAIGNSENYTCVPLFCSGTGVNEAVLHSIGRSTVLVVSAGRYGMRLAKIAQQLGHETIVHECPPFAQINLDAIVRILRSNTNISYLLFAHHETTSTILAPINEICAVAKRFGVKTIVDTISSLYGHNIDFEKNGPDFFSLTANKCLESVPGISFLFAKKEAMLSLRNKSTSFYFDVFAHWERYENGDGLSRFTLPINVIMAAHRACQLLEEETVAGRFARYSKLKRTFSNIMMHHGYRKFETAGLNTASMLQMYCLPHDVNFAHLQNHLRSRGIIIYTDRNNLAENRFFIATMGPITDTMVDHFKKSLHEFHIKEEATV